MKREYIIEDEFPENWFYFGELLEELIGFDVLNIKDLKYLKTDLNQDNLECDIEKIRFKHSYSHIIVKSNHVDIIFDFKEKTLKGIFNYNDLRKNLNLELSNEQIFYIWKSIYANNIFAWNEKRYQEGAHAHNFITFDGYRWRLDLLFKDGSFLSFSGLNEHPDTYPFFAIDILNITGYDILRIDKIYYEQFEYYKKYGLKHLITDRIN